MKPDSKIHPSRGKILKLLESFSSPLFPVEPGDPSREHAEFLEGLKACNDCGLREGATQPVPGHGSLDASLMMVGEAPGAEEDRLGIPFSGPAGHLLDRSLAKLGVRRSRIYITNVVRYRPPGNRMPHAGEINACISHLLIEIRTIRPRIIAALGAVAAQSLLGTKEGLKTLRGRYVEAGVFQIFPMFHPAYALRNLDRDPSILAVFETDLRRVCGDAGLLP
jgi:uracil-DNA glycosylase family 4